MTPARLSLNALAVVLTVALLHQVAAHEPYGVDDWTRTAIEQASEEFGVSYHELYETMHCESAHFDPRVIYGPRLGALGEQGGLQYLGGARHYLWQRSPWAAYSPFDPHAAARVTAWNWMIEPATKRQWSCWRLLFGRGW